MASAELLVLSETWPVSTLSGEPSLTSGTLIVLREPGGGFLLSVSSGDENHPDNIEVQFPLTASDAARVRQALADEPSCDE